jgi:hypothetical protein
LVQGVNLAEAEMNDTACWILVEKCHDTGSKLSESEATDFVRWFDATMARAYNRGLWGAAYVMNGGCGDDSFIDFRCCLISRGEAALLGALKDPDRVRPTRPCGQSRYVPIQWWCYPDTNSRSDRYRLRRAMDP